VTSTTGGDPLVFRVPLRPGDRVRVGRPLYASDDALVVLGYPINPKLLQNRPGDRTRKIFAASQQELNCL
jgi:hypothetical protein